MCNFNKCKRNDYLISSVAPILHSKPFLMVTELVASKVVEPLSIMTGPSSTAEEMLRPITISSPVTIDVLLNV